MVDVYIGSKMSKRDIASIFKVLIKNISAKNINKAKAVVNIHNAPVATKRRRKRGGPNNPKKPIGPLDLNRLYPTIARNGNVTSSPDNEDKRRQDNEIAKQSNDIKRLTNQLALPPPPTGQQRQLVDQAFY